MFGYALDRKTLYILIAILVGGRLLTYINNPEIIIGILFTIPGVLIAITFHEFAHGYAAYKLGDNTAKNEGRLTLNPLDHLDPIGSIMLLFAGFGWGKPVHVNPNNYTRRMSMDKAEAIVSIAGPAMNIVLAFIFTLVYLATIKYAGTAFLSSSVGKVIITMIYSIVSINIGLGVFNLIPLPPLDGSKVIKPFLSTKAKMWFENNEQIFYIVFVILWITPIAGYIISPVISWVSTGILSLGNLIIR